MILEVDTHFPQPGIVEHAIEIIKNNHGIIAYPTDTVYGIGCDIHDKIAVKKINAIKKRPSDAPYSILFKNILQVKKYAYVSKRQEAILKKHLPGAFTFILKVKKSVPVWVNGGVGTIGIRIPRNRLCATLVTNLGKPLITTSLNVSGKPLKTSINKTSKALISKIDVVLDAGELAEKGSTIVDITKDVPVVIRKGVEKFA